MIPVPSALHNKAEESGLAHTAGRRILKASNKLTELIGFFPKYMP